MAKILFFMTLIILVFPVFTFADSADDDEAPSTPSDNCNNFCYLLSVCGVTCLEDNCFQFCEYNEENIDFNCLDFDDCQATDECICSAIGNAPTDDDNNDTTDDDDNDNNDDSGGCDVSHSDAGPALTVVMLVIGLLALWISARRGRAKNN